MPTSPAYTSQWVQHERTLTQLAEKYDAQNLSLPPLVKQKWLLEKWLEDLGEFIRGLLSGFGDLKGDFSVDLFLMIAYAVAALLIFFLLHRIYKWIRGAFPNTAETPLRPPGELKGDALLRRMDEELQKCLAASDFSSALRLRWKIFLHKNDLKASLTPHEYFRRGPGHFSTSQNLVHRIYRTMFGCSPDPGSDFREVDEELKADTLGTSS